ncbi:LAGLIDADG family homing endonuclease, partial [Serratia marcescens]|uniref:LAGLIDADG family homing endonuclease n=1 Tax=Serratia marcescens TaxID=615 RepID=UPI0019105944
LLDNNRQLLYKLKNYFKIGKIYIDQNNNMNHYYIKNNNKLLKMIIPIFDKYL